MGERYKLPVRITELLTEDGWFYISCTECWKKLTLEEGVHNCPQCPTTVPLARYRFVVRAVDTSSADIPSAQFADLYFFGPRGEAAIGKEAWMLVSSVRGNANEIPQDLLAIVGKDFNVVVTDANR